MDRASQTSNRVSVVLWITAIALAVCAIVVVLSPALRIEHWVGRFELVVQVDASPDVGVDHIHYSTYSDEAALREAQFIDPELKRWSVQVDDCDGRTFTADVKSWGSRTGDGHEITYQHHHLIVMRFRLKDGSTVVKQARIPDGRGRREITVSLP